MTSWMKNQTANLCNTVSASMTATLDALVKRLFWVCEIASLLYNRIMDNIEYGHERLKDIEK